MCIFGSYSYERWLPPIRFKVEIIYACWSFIFSTRLGFGGGHSLICGIPTFQPYIWKLNIYDIYIYILMHDSFLNTTSNHGPLKTFMASHDLRTPQQFWLSCRSGGCDRSLNRQWLVWPQSRPVLRCQPFRLMRPVGQTYHKQFLTMKLPWMTVYHSIFSTIRIQIQNWQIKDLSTIFHDNSSSIVSRRLWVLYY